jgi:hypothetical protein
MNCFIRGVFSPVFLGLLSQACFCHESSILRKGYEDLRIEVVVSGLLGVLGPSTGITVVGRLAFHQCLYVTCVQTGTLVHC